MTAIEKERQQLQIELDSKKTLSERNKLGQYSTPYELATQICKYIISLTGTKIDSFLEPAIGTGVFFSVMSDIAEIKKAVGYEIDPFYFKPAQKIWKDHKIDLRNRDFLEETPTEKFSLLISNPPYSRHHHIPTDLKRYLSKTIRQNFGINVSGLAGLHVYFIILSTLWLAEDGLSCWLIPSEFLYVNYGEALKRFLLSEVDLLAIHSFDEKEVKFADALVSSSIVIFRKSKTKSRDVKFSFGSDINTPAKKAVVAKTELNPTKKWNEAYIFRESFGDAQEATLDKFFNITRGIATGDNKFFMVNEETIKTFGIPMEVLSRVIPPPRKLSSTCYTLKNAQEDGLYLISCGESMENIRTKYTGLFNYLSLGEESGVSGRANCMHRNPWYRLEKRLPPPILVSYMGRDTEEGTPLKFILNKAEALATNSYLGLYPKPEYAHNFKDPKIKETVWLKLSEISKEILISHGRIYGGGLIKWEPKELGSIPCGVLSHILSSSQPSIFD